MPSTITRYKCNICGGEYEQSSDATTCEGKHPGELRFGNDRQVFEPGMKLPKELRLTSGGRDIFYRRVN